MFCERVLGTLDDADDAGVDWLDLTWMDCTQRAQRKRTRGGVEIRVLLAVGQTPRHRDVLFRDGAATIAVNLVPADVLVCRPGTAEELARLAVQLGNLHVPVQVSGDTLVVIPDGPTEAALKAANVIGHGETRRFMPEKCSVAGITTRAADFAVRRPVAG